MPPRYTAIQFISLFPKEGYHWGQDDQSCFFYQGGETDEAEILEKVALFCDFSEACRQIIPEDSSILKVVVAPEFFIRGAYGAINIEEAHRILQEMRRLCGGEEWRDWLLIPGTVAAYLSMDTVDGALCKEMFNICLYQKGGCLEADGEHEGLVYKKTIASCDFIDMTIDENRIYGKLGKWQHQEEYEFHIAEGLSYFDRAKAPEGPYRKLMGGHFFEIDGVRFVLEICLDHFLHKAKTVIDHGLGVPGDVHLIVAKGIKPDPDHAAIVPQGLLVHVDGSDSGYSTLLRKELDGSFVEITEGERRECGEIYIDIFPCMPLPSRNEQVLDVRSSQDYDISSR